MKAAMAAGGKRKASEARSKFDKCVNDHPDLFTEHGSACLLKDLTSRRKILRAVETILILPVYYLLERAVSAI